MFSFSEQEVSSTYSCEEDNLCYDAVVIWIEFSSQKIKR